MRKVCATAVLCLTLVSCSVGPRYQRPTAPAPPAYREQPSGAQWTTANPDGTQLRTNWWELFADSQLNRLEQMVAVSNQNVVQAEARFRQARALVAANRANYYPLIAAQPSITTSEASGRSANRRFTVGGTQTQYSLPFTASWEPDLWGRVGLGVQNAVANTQSSAADLAAMRLSMQAELAADYLQLEGMDMDMRLLNENIAAYEKALQLTVNRYNGGVASRTDIVQAQTQLESTRAALIDLGVSRAALEHAVAVLTGQPPAALSISPGNINGPPPPIPPGVPSLLLERRPDIASAERLVAAANAQIGLARVAYYPTVTLGATGGAQSSSFINWLTWPSRFWSLGPSAAETLLDFGRRRAQVAGAQAAYDATVAAYRQTVLSAFQDVEDNLAALHLLEQEAIQQDSAVKNAKTALELEIDRYKSGTASYLDVITSQTIALTNERAAVAILSRRMTAAVQLIRALGGGWQASDLPTSEQLKHASTAKPH